MWTGYAFSCRELFMTMPKKFFKLSTKDKLESFKTTKNTSQRIAARDCNCRWTCLFYSSVTNDNCNTTNSGCGFLWTQECTAVV